MQRRIERADHHRESVHGFEQALEILTLHGQQLRERFPAILLVVRQNHRLHMRQPVFREEHVLRAAQADPFSAERTRGLRIPRNVRVRANPEFAAVLVGNLHELREHRRVRIGILRRRLPEVNSAGCPVDRNPLAFSNRERFVAGLHCRGLRAVVNRDGTATHDAGHAHAAGHNRRVRALAADRGHDSLRGVHSVNIVRSRFLADQNDGAIRRHLDRVFRRKREPPNGRARAGVNPSRELRQLPQRLHIENRVEQLVELVRSNAHHRRLLVDEAFVR